MKKIILLFLAVSLLTVSCDFMNKIRGEDQYVENVEFKNGKYVLYEGEAEVCYLSVSPQDSFEWYETEYSIENTEVVSFEDCTDNYCIIKAKKEGTSVVTASIGGKTGKTVVTVRSR